MTRKLIILFTMVGLLTGHVYAQQKTEVPVKIDYLKKVETYRKMRNGGIVLTLVGSVLAVAGTVKMSNLKSEGKYPDETTFTNGSVCIITGYMCLGAGLPLWIVGGISHKKYSKLRDLSINLNATPQSQGLTLTYRF